MAATIASRRARAATHPASSSRRLSLQGQWDNDRFDVLHPTASRKGPSGPAGGFSLALLVRRHASDKA